MKKIFVTFFVYLLSTTYLVAEINLICASTTYSSRIMGELETSEVMPSTFTVVIENLGGNKVIARVKGSAETGHKCSPYKGRADDSSYDLKCKRSGAEEKMKINRISGRFSNTEHIPGKSEWLIQTSGLCRKGVQQF
ncbi:hypothetical protein N9C92_01530 [Candidatus Pelagibacter sp.]|nr:hypothetical protein [Candidatus Pelagibacter sp.]